MPDTADAPTTTEAPPSTPASSEALDAAAAASSGVASSPTPAPSPEAPVPASGEPGEGTPSLQDYVEDESLDLDSADLPDATKSELRTLRKQTKQYRETAKPWTEATKDWHAEDIETLRNALEQGPQNPDLVGEWFLNSAKSLLGDRFSELTGAEPVVPEVGDTDEDGETLTAADVDRLVEEKIAAREAAAKEQDSIKAQVQTIISETEALGFGPSHWLHKTLLLTAKEETSGDLAKAAELLRDRQGDTAEPSGVAAEAGHTPASPEGGTLDGTKRPTSLTAAVNERLDKVLGNSRGFKDPLV